MKFEKGRSGNSAGRRPGTGKHQQFRKILEAKAPELLERAIEMALEGDQKMMAMCLDRVLPALRTVDTPGRLPDFGDAKTLEEKTTAVMKAISGGEITVNDGLSLVQTCANAARVAEVSELQKRIEQLEGQRRPRAA